MEGFLQPRQRNSFRTQRTKQSLIYGFLALIGVLQFLFVYFYFSAPTSDTSAHSPVEGRKESGGGSALTTKPSPPALDTAFWDKHFKDKSSVKWNEFAMELLLEHSEHVKSLSAEIVPALGGHLDIDGDGKITKKEFIRFVQRFGDDGLRKGLQLAVDIALDNRWRRSAVDRARPDARGCALRLDSGVSNFVELEASGDLQFAGAKPFTIEMWVRPEQILSDEAVRDKPRARFGGTLFAKYNRGVRGQFFVAVRETGELWFQREVAPWGMASEHAIPPRHWTHVAAAYGAGRSKVYVNGTLQGSQREGPVGDDVTTQVLIGAILDHGKADSVFNGAIDEVRLWGVDRTQSEIVEAMNTTLTGLEYGLIGYWRV